MNQSTTGKPGFNRTLLVVLIMVIVAGAVETVVRAEFHSDKNGEVVRLPSCSDDIFRPEPSCAWSRY